MNTIDHKAFAPTTVPATDERTRPMRKTLDSIRAGGRMLASLAHREPGFCERHLLDGRLGVEIRRATW